MKISLPIDRECYKHAENGNMIRHGRCDGPIDREMNDRLEISLADTVLDIDKEKGWKRETAPTGRCPSPSSVSGQN